MGVMERICNFLLLAFLAAVCNINLLTAQDTLHIRQGFKAEEPVYEVTHLIIDDNVEIDIRANENFTLITQNSYIGSNVRFIGVGKEGTRGSTGSAGVSGGPCGDASPGKPGGSGGDGADGVNVLINLGVIQQIGDEILIDVQGGMGGRGGTGGAGGTGGRADCSSRCSGKVGARGGNGGNGGNGGEGGDVTVYYNPSVGYGSDVPKRLSIISSGGAQGASGAGGAGGAGGEGKKCPLGYKHGPGASGHRGNTGSSGDKGKDGRQEQLIAKVQSPAPDRRLALLIANWEYPEKAKLFQPLTCPEADYKRLRDLFQNQFGFEVVGGSNLTRDQIDRELKEFEKLIKKDPNCVALVYYIGHGFMHNGFTYLTAIDADPVDVKEKRRDQKILGGSVSLESDVFNHLQHNEGLNLFCIDACRTDDIVRTNSSSRNGRPTTLNNMWVMYANHKGAETTGCSAGRNSSVYTSAFIEQAILRQELDYLARGMSKSMKASHQNPEVVSSNDFYFFFTR